VDRRGVHDRSRLGRGDDAPPALLTAVLPDLAEGDEPFRLLSGEEAADRLGGLAEPGIVGVDEGAGDQARRATVDAAGPEGGVQFVGEREADRGLGLRDAPVQRHRGHLVRGQLVLDQQVADLGAIAVGQHDLDAGGDDVGDVTGGLGDGVALGAGGRGAVGAGHGVAAQGDDDSGCAHPRDPSGKMP
jgi:hypothetical protein